MKSCRTFLKESIGWRFLISISWIFFGVRKEQFWMNRSGTRCSGHFNPLSLSGSNFGDINLSTHPLSLPTLSWLGSLGGAGTYPACLWAKEGTSGWKSQGCAFTLTSSNKQFIKPNAALALILLDLLEVLMANHGISLSLLSEIGIPVMTYTWNVTRYHKVLWQEEVCTAISTVRLSKQGAGAASVCTLNYLLKTFLVTLRRTCFNCVDITLLRADHQLSSSYNASLCNIDRNNPWWEKK